MTREEAQARMDRAFAVLARPGREAPGNEVAEGLELQEAYDAAVAAAQAGVERLPYAASYLFMRLAAHDWLGRLHGLGDLDRRLAEQGESVGPHMQVQLARIGPALEDRLELLRQRRAWGEAVERAAAPVTRRPRPAGGKLRLGFVSSHLRHTNVGVFAWPLFEHKDADRFELFVYSPFAGPEDPIQALFRGWSDGWRQAPGAEPRAMAETIAADGIDMLVEFGEPYAWAVCAHRPARLQASWMGFSSSVGLPGIDHIILDPWLVPDDPRLVLETPLVMPNCAVAMTEAYFEPEPRLPETTPESRNGFVTFGTMNAPYKFSPACLDLWGRVLAAVPDSRFLVVRPEAAVPVFRHNLRQAFAAHGIAPERVRFEAVRGRHMPWYNEIDIALDTLPVTGGTTTCETLWMGVPAVTLVGAAPFERMSWSLLANAGLGDLAARSPEEYLRIAVALAADPARRQALKRGLRDQIRARPLGQSMRFAQDFYDLVAGAAASPEGA
jgi:predicted O-linked N-acetylglucosamine transferase (SPINDLY family)